MVAIRCEPGQARKGAAAAADSSAVIRLSVAFNNARDSGLFALRTAEGS